MTLKVGDRVCSSKTMRDMITLGGKRPAARYYVYGTVTHVYGKELPHVVRVKDDNGEVWFCHEDNMELVRC